MLAFASLGAFAAPHEYTALLKAGKLDDVERATQAKLAADPYNADALLGRTDWLLSTGAISRIDEAIQLAERCIAAHPKRSACFESLGNTLGTKAVNAGIFSAMGYAKKIRDAFKKAVELDSRNLDARFSLLQFYLQAPTVAGGGKGKAQELIADTTQLSPDAGRLMQGLLDLSERDYPKAETAAQANLAADSAAMQDRQMGLMTGVGSSLLREKRYADATRLFTELQKRYPASEWGPYGMARTMQEQGKHQDAVGWFEKALSLKPDAHVHYRMAQSLQALNDKVRALAAYERAINFKPELNGKLRADAQDQIKNLNG